ncbi:hypothetical protein FDP41_007746 [Naegleria fowleri]|uniref:DNA mismatch repair protein S5 domain-containing protein n=1 Tax=Naegleria fowleri TaxID=5763 RepID=A0A6A5C9I1_NAEFO|nr:uncharacterized protein FDP41_007746 [Naegleria fowleri]KAF0983831.1 hypothetical protein FDP41_007746 [Naegleria fowleri]
MSSPSTFQSTGGAPTIGSAPTVGGSSSTPTTSTTTINSSNSNNNHNSGPIKNTKKPKSLQIVSSPPIIKKLPDDVQQFLKSGTNIGCLSDCIKELVENAIDAHATNIEILLTQSGFTSICVKDNGDGIPQENFDTLCKRYYTHKYSESHRDGQQCDYLGYKGEALNSICNISKDIHVKTKYGDNDSELGSHIIYDKRGENLSVNSIRHSKGTTIVVNELFSAIPVRRKCFQNDLKKQLEHTITILKRIALIHFNIRFLLKDGDKTLFLKLANIQTMKASLQAVFGAGNIFEHLYFYDGALNTNTATATISATHDTPSTNGATLTSSSSSDNSVVHTNINSSSENALPPYSIQCYVPLYETIAKSNDTTLSPEELTPLKDITKFVSTTKPHIYANNRVILEYKEIQQAMKDIVSNFFRNQKGVSSNLFYILIIRVDSHYFDVTINPNKTKMISSLDEAIKKELQTNIIKHYAEEVRKFKENNSIKLLSQDDPNIIDNSNAVLNVSRILASSPSKNKNQPPSSLNSSPNSTTLSLSSPPQPQPSFLNDTTPQSSRRSDDSSSPPPAKSSISSGCSAVSSDGSSVGGGGGGKNSFHQSNTRTTTTTTTTRDGSRQLTLISSFSKQNNSTPSTRPPQRDIPLDDSLLDSVQSLDEIFGSPIVVGGEGVPNKSGSGGDGSNQREPNKTTRSESHRSFQRNPNAMEDDEDDHLLLNNDHRTTTTSLTSKRVHAADSRHYSSPSSSSTSVSAPPSCISDINNLKCTNSKKRKTLQTSINLVPNATQQQESSNYEITIQDSVELNVEYLTKKRKKFIECMTSESSAYVNNNTDCRVLKSELSDPSKVQILGSIQHKLGVLYHCEHKNLLFANLLQMKEDCLYHNLLQTYDLSTSIIPLQSPLNLLTILSKDAKTSKAYRRLCVKKEYQSIFQQNGFQIEFEVEPLLNEKQKRIVRIDLVGMVSNNVFNTSGTNDHYSYSQDNLIEILSKIDEFERDILKNEEIVKLMSERKIAKDDLISQFTVMH